MSIVACFVTSTIFSIGIQQNQHRTAGFELPLCAGLVVAKSDSVIFNMVPSRTSKQENPTGTANIWSCSNG